MSELKMAFSENLSVGGPNFQISKRKAQAIKMISYFIQSRLVIDYATARTARILSIV